MSGTLLPRSKDSMHADETAQFRAPYQPNIGDDVTLTIRIGREDEADVWLIMDGREDVPMKRVREDSHFSYYEAQTGRLSDAPLSYHFRVDYADAVLYYNKLGVCEVVNTDYDFHIYPGYYVPEWAQGAVIYQIFVDRFCNGDPANDVQTGEYAYIGGQVSHADTWDALPGRFDVRRFYGGDLQGVRQKLDYLQDLGVEVIYLNPIFVSPSNHKYDAQDYDHIDPHLAVIPFDEGEVLPEGSFDNHEATRYINRTTRKENLEAADAYFAELVREIHARGMKIILDGVFNHCGSFNRYMDAEFLYSDRPGYEPGAFITGSSPYHSYFSFEEDSFWPCNRAYNGWWGHRTLPKLNYEASPELEADMLRIGRKWVSEPYCADGWRLDVAADLGHSEAYNHEFWKKFRTNVREAAPQTLILAEHYGDPAAHLSGGEWDTVMNYDAFMDPVTYFLTGLDKHSDSYDGGRLGNGDWFFRNITHHMSRMSGPSLLAAMNELSNHDHSRFMTRTNHTVGRLSSRGSEAAERGINKAVFRLGVVMQMTWPGAPTVYYGDEAGLVGWTDPDNRRTYPWGREDLEMIEFHHYIIGIHKRTQCLRTGSLVLLTAQPGMISYGRFDESGYAVVVVNVSEAHQKLYVPVWRVGAPENDPEAICRVMQTGISGYNVGRVPYETRDGYIVADMAPTSCAVFTDTFGD